MGDLSTVILNYFQPLQFNIYLCKQMHSIFKLNHNNSKNVVDGSKEIVGAAD